MSRVEKKNISEEIKRMKSLMGFKFEDNSHDVLSEQIHRLLTESVTIPYSQVATYPAGDSDPSNFIDNFVENLIKKIDEDPEGKKMRDSGQMTLLDGKFIGSASNSWGKDKTGYDRENDYKTIVKPSETDLYSKNINLARERANKFQEALWPKLLKYNIKKNNDVSKISSSAIVVNTGGVNDNARDKNKYPNEGQRISVNLKFEYSSKIVKKPDTIDITSIFKPTEIKSEFILAGSYFCNGKNSQGKTSINTDTYLEQCKELPQNLKDEKHISSWEIKWNTNVVKNAYTVPLYRWNFYWDKNGKITKIVGQQFNNDTKYPINKSFPPSNDIPKNDPTMMSFMGINQNDKDGGTLYKNFIKPFI